MPFPAVVNGITFDLDDFDGLAYVNGLPDSVEAMGDHGSRDLLGTSVTSFALTTGVKSIVASTNRAYVAGMNVTIANSATNFATAVVNSYVPSTGALEINIVAAGDITGAGTFAAWNIYPINAKGAGTLCDPLPISRGGIGRAYTSTATSRFQDKGPGIFNCGNPSYNMAELMDDFGQANPFYTDKEGNTDYNVGYCVRTTDSSASMLRGADYSTQVFNQMKNRPGQFAAKVGVQGSAITVTHGSSGYVSAVGGGSIYFATSIKNANAILGEQMTIYVGLKSHYSTSLGNIFDYGGIGFRLVNGYQSYVLNCLVANKGTMTALPLTFGQCLGFRVDPNNGIVEFYVFPGPITGMFDSTPVATLPIPSVLLDNSLGALLHPAVTFQKNLGGDTRYMNCEYLYCAKNLRRG